MLDCLQGKVNSITPKKFVRIAKKSLTRKRTSTGPVGSTNPNGAVRCGGAAVSEVVNSQDVNLASTKQRQTMKKTKSTRIK